MKVSELAGALLDYWVARAEGMQHVRINRDADPHECYMWERERGLCSGDLWRPSTNWEQGGPIIEREQIGIKHQLVSGFENECWEAQIGDWQFGEPMLNGGAYPDFQGSGPTPLIAAMRAFVASKFGSSVEDSPSGSRKVS